MTNGRTYVVFAIAVIGCALGGFTQTATNVMVVAIGQDFGISLAFAQLATTVFMLASGVFMPVTAFLTKRYPLRTLLVLAWALQLAGSLIIFVSPNFIIVIIGRILQAVSIGVTMPLVQTLAVTRFPGKVSIAMGIAGIALGFAPNVGPTVGGVFAGSIGWRYFFLVLVVFSIVLIIVSLIAADTDEPAFGEQHLDMVSVLLSTIGFGALLLGFSNASDTGFADAATIACLVIGAIGVIAFLVRQQRGKNPLINLSIFKNGRFRYGFIGIACLCGSFLGITLVLPLFWQNIAGGTALEAGMLLLPAAVAALIMNPVAGILSNKLGYYKVIFAAAICMIIGAGSFLFTTAETPFWALMIMQALRAIGISSLIGPIAAWSLETLQPVLTADGSSFSTLIRQISGSIATALMVLGISTGATMGNALFGFHIAYGISAVLAIALFVAILIQRIREARGAA